MLRRQSLNQENMNLLRDVAQLQVHLGHYDILQETRWQILKLRPNLRQNWIGYGVACHLNNNLSETKRVLKAYFSTLKVCNVWIYVSLLCLKWLVVYAEYPGLWCGTLRSAALLHSSSWRPRWILGSSQSAWWILKGAFYCWPNSHHWVQRYAHSRFLSLPPAYTLITPL